MSSSGESVLFNIGAFMLKELKNELEKLRDPEYKEFQAKIIPNISSERILGVRIPVLRKFAKEKILNSTKTKTEFMMSFPYKYHEGEVLHMMILEKEKDINLVFEDLDKFLPYVSNWAVSDYASPKVILLNREFTLKHVKKWLAVDPNISPYKIRYAIKILKDHFLDVEFSPEYIDWVVNVKSDDYYVEMMKAWFIAEALCKQYEASIVVLQEYKLDAKTHNQAIQKAIDSRRIDHETKKYLRTLRLPGGVLKRI